MATATRDYGRPEDTIDQREARWSNRPPWDWKANLYSPPPPPPPPPFAALSLPPSPPISAPSLQQAHPPLVFSSWAPGSWASLSFFSSSRLSVSRFGWLRVPECPRAFSHATVEIEGLGLSAVGCAFTHSLTHSFTPSLFTHFSLLLLPLSSFLLPASPSPLPPSTSQNSGPCLLFDRGQGAEGLWRVDRCTGRVFGFVFTSGSRLGGGHRATVSRNSIATQQLEQRYSLETREAPHGGSRSVSSLGQGAEGCDGLLHVRMLLLQTRT